MKNLTDHLYACLFSNGTVKVGRSAFPHARIASHERRLSCAGVTLSSRHVAVAVGHIVPAEAALIERCRRAADQCNSSEWFAGLQFAQVCAWVDEIAATSFSAPAQATRARGARNAALDDAIDIAGGPTALARALQQRGHDVKSHATVNAWRLQGVVPGDYCPDIEVITGVPCEGLRPSTNWGLLRGTPTPTEAR